MMIPGRAAQVAAVLLLASGPALRAFPVPEHGVEIRSASYGCEDQKLDASATVRALYTGKPEFVKATKAAKTSFNDLFGRDPAPHRYKSLTIHCTLATLFGPTEFDKIFIERELPEFWEFIEANRGYLKK